MEGYPFNPCLTEAQYKEMEQKVSTTLSGLEGELKGKFYPLTGMDKAVQQQLIDDHFLFKEGLYFPTVLPSLNLLINNCYSQVIVSCKPPMLAVTGHLDVVSTTMTTKHSWSGAMRKIIFASFPCKWAVIWAKCTVAW
jgi:hypothetical protein